MLPATQVSTEIRAPAGGGGSANLVLGRLKAGIIPAIGPRWGPGVAGAGLFAVLTLYDEGVDRFAGLTGRLQVPGEWQRPACGIWTAEQLARHLLAMAGWYHAWLDRAEAGDASPPFAAGQLAAQNAAALDALGDMPGPDAVARFVSSARAYRKRVVPAWDLPWYPRGTVTAGLHAGMAACEWHLQTWDLARSRGLGHRPSDPATLFAAAGACLARARGGVGGRAASALVPVGSRLGPWRALLRRSGRTPATGD